MSFEDFKQTVMDDYLLACQSREASLLGRKEVLTGKAKFGIFGDGKEIPQIAMAKAFKEGDFRSGYYRDQTFMFASGMASIESFFAQLYANPELEHDPFSAGRQMNAHFATRSLDEDGTWKDLTAQKNSAADTSPTASQMGRAVGLAMASKMYRKSPALKDMESFSKKGNEVVFTTIGDASTSEGIFWESLNAVGVMQVPMALFIWDDGYGISVPQEYQTTKGNISEILSGFQTNEEGDGFDIYRVKAWDYPGLVETFEKGIAKVRETHMPCIFHVQEVTQPQGHSTSGSHERYKSKERLAWEEEWDCIRKMKEWMIESAICTNDELEAIESQAKEDIKRYKKSAWDTYNKPIKEDIATVTALFDQIAASSAQVDAINQTKTDLTTAIDPIRHHVVKAVKAVLRRSNGEESDARTQLVNWLENSNETNQELFNTYLHSQSSQSAMRVPIVPASYSDDSPSINGSEILNACFDNMLEREPAFMAFGEDLGFIGGVNQGFAGMQEKHGEERVFDTGIRELTIMGQGIGLAMRGIRPIAEIQYLDYLIYGLQPLTDDLATLQYRTKGGQKAPMIIRTRGHRLEGIWHTGSPMQMILGSLRGVYVLVPRNMTQAAGFYNTMLQSDEPALLIECLNGYRLKEKLPDNIGEFTLPLGVPEVIEEGDDITLVTYGSCVRVAQEAMRQLSEVGISVELVDVQTLLPFDVNHLIAESAKKTNRLLFLDEDVPGGASAYMMQQVIEHQDIWQWLDSEPQTLSAHSHRAAYASDGDYFSKPNAEDVFEKVYSIMHEVDPGEYPQIW
jgi:pyruvate/2-oxoglutarate/acetoin dehydrogenase E1 component/TPP-dependent pyruvate/acetoin dehydrogenase alpha subunit